jgi:dTDP-4-amino-4,6-dideoxygalactose transaminase
MPVNPEVSIPVFKPLLEDEEQAAVTEAIANGWLGMGAFVGQFEAALKELLEAEDRHVVAVSTGHAALHLALLLAGVGPGDEVITPSFNNIADFQAIIATGAEPVFCDIDDQTLCLVPEAVDALVGPKTRAVIAMDYACHTADHEALASVAGRHGLRVVHDAAHALGSRRNGRMIGSASDVAIFSFDPVKTITTIDGGALVVRSSEEVAALHEMRLIGMGQPATVMYENRRAWTYDVKGLGFRYHLANLHAALGLAQLAKFSRIAKSRVETFAMYQRDLRDLPWLQVPDTSLSETVPFIFYVRVPAAVRDELRSHLSSLGVDTGIHWQPGHWFTRFADCRQGDLSVTERAGREILTLPFHSAMPEATIQRVVDGVRSFRP